jgi:hypothetical protein
MPKSDAPKRRAEHGSNLAEVVVNFSKKVGGGMGLRLRGLWRDHASERLELQYPRRPTGSMVTALLDASEKELPTVTPEALWTIGLHCPKPRKRASVAPADQADSPMSLEE